MKIENSNNVAFEGLALLKTNGKKGQQIRCANIDSKTFNQMSDRYEVSGKWNKDIKPFSKEQKFINTLRKTLGIKKSELGEIKSIVHKFDEVQIAGKNGRLTIIAEDNPYTQETRKHIGLDYPMA